MVEVWMPKCRTLQVENQKICAEISNKNKECKQVFTDASKTGDTERAFFYWFYQQNSKATIKSTRILQVNLKELLIKILTIPNWNKKQDLRNETIICKYS